MVTIEMCIRAAIRTWTVYTCTETSLVLPVGHGRFIRAPKHHSCCPYMGLYILGAIRTWTVYTCTETSLVLPVGHGLVYTCTETSLVVPFGHGRFIRAPKHHSCCPSDMDGLYVHRNITRAAIRTWTVYNYTCTETSLVLPFELLLGFPL